MMNLKPGEVKAVDFDPWAGPDIFRAIPLTESQMEIWLSCALGGKEANIAYNESNSLIFSGQMNGKALERALSTLVSRHESLRASFSANGRYMLIYTDIPYPFPFLDFSTYPQEKKEEKLREILSQDAEYAFNLTKGPLFKVTLIKLGEQEYHFTFTAHHLIIDGWSIGVVMQELGMIYSAYVQGLAPELPDPKSFSEYGKEQYGYLQGEEYKKVMDYWKGLFENSVPVLDLPTDGPRPTTRTFKSSRLDYSPDPGLLASLKKLGLMTGCTFVSTLMAAFEVYLNKVTGQSEIILGVPTAGQSIGGYYDLVGHCVNFLPLRSHVNGKLTFEAYLSIRKNQIYKAFDHQQITFGSLLRNLKIVRDSSRVPLVPVIFNVDFGKDEGVDFHGLKFRMISNPKAYLNFEMFLNVNGSEKAAVFEWSYNRLLFKEETMRGMMDDFVGLLQQIALYPEWKIRDYTLPSNKIHEKLPAWNNTRRDFPKDVPITRLIHDMAFQYPDKVAIEFFDQTLTYKQLDEKSSQLAAFLIEWGVDVEDIVGVCLDRSAEMVVVLLGILKAGGAYLPLDPEYPRERIAYMFENSNACLLITSDRLKNRLHAGDREKTVEMIWGELEKHPQQFPLVTLTGNSLAYILYTSGSTGRPKGVQVEHHSLTNFLLSMKETPGMDFHDRLLGITTISFDIAVLELFLPLLTGATLVLTDTDTARDGRRLMELIEEKDISMVQATPATWRMLGNAGWEGKLPIKALCGGEALPNDLAEKLLTNCKSVWNVYGPTETTVWSTLKELKHDDPCITVGRPIWNTYVYLLDEDRMMVPEGKIGEIYIGGEGVARGYLNREDLTNERFFDDPFSEVHGARIYRTGDLGQFLQNGEILCLGRVDHQVKVRGHRIELGEIEQVIREIDGVKESVVIAREDIPGNQRLVAYLLLEGQTARLGGYATKEQIIAWKSVLQKSLPAYMIPNDWVILERFPLTSNNKIDRKALPKPPDPKSHEEDGEDLHYSGSQQVIADIWSRSLGISKVGLDDDFFEIGGHSLIAVEVMTRLEKESGIKLPLSILFEYPTIKELAGLLESKEASIQWKTLIPIKPDGINTPLYIVHGLGMNVLPFYSIARHLDLEQPLFGIQAIGLNGAVESPKTVEAIASEYLKEILEQNPNGPYSLAGYSFGGMIAFEMAQQLKKMGKDIKSLIMFDTNAIRSDHMDPLGIRINNRLKTEIGKRVFDLKMLIKNPTLLKRIKKASFENKWGKVKNFLHLDDKGRKQGNDILDIVEKIKKTHLEAGKNYVLSKYDGEIYLFRAKIRTSYEKDMKYFGWKPFVKKVHIIEMDGEHTTMFDPPHEREFVRKLQDVLNTP